MKKSLIFAAVSLAASVFAADVAVSVTAGGWATNNGLKWGKDDKGVLTYTLVKAGELGKDGKVNHWNTQIIPNQKGLPAGKYKVDFKIKSSTANKFSLFIFPGSDPTFGAKNITLEANKEIPVSIEFTIPEKCANKTFRLPCIPIGHAAAGTVITLSDYKITKL